MMSEMNLVTQTRNIQMLVISSRGYSWIEPLRHQLASVQLVKDPETSDEALASQAFDIILYDDQTFDMSAAEVVDTIHMQHPNALIGIISQKLGVAYYHEMIEAGATDALPANFDDETMIQRISALVRQSEHNRQLAHRTRRLHAINLLSQKLQESVHPNLMMVDAIELICSYFDIYGVAITIKHGQTYHVHAGTQDARRRVYETKQEMREQNPLRQVISSNISLIFPDVTQHPYYKAIPVINSPKSSVIVPIRHGMRVLGSLALFSREQVFTPADVAVFELLGSNFATAYQNAVEQYSREIDVQSMRYVLEAWPRLNAVYTRPDIVRILHDFVFEIETVSAVGVWIFSRMGMSEAYTYSDFDLFDDELIKLREDKNLETVVAEFEESIAPRYYQREDRKLPLLEPIFEVLGVNELTIVPIAGNSFEGVLLISNQHMQPITTTDMGLIENIARVSANVLERNTLIESLQTEQEKLQEQTGRVEGVLRTIDEGIFFVDENDEVIYTNPQFSELTNITPSAVLGNSYNAVFQSLSIMSIDQQQVYERLIQAAAQVSANDSELDDIYPFVEINTLSNKTMVIEFMRVDTSTQQRGWIGVIVNRDSNIVEQETGYSEMLGHMLDDMTIPIIELNNTAIALPSQYDMLPPSNFETLLTTMSEDVQQMQSMWGNFVQIFRGETDGIQLRSTRVNPAEFIQDILTNRRLSLYRRQIRFEYEESGAEIRIDERQMRQCFINLVEFLSNLSNRGAPIFVDIAIENNQVVFTLQEKTTILPQNELSNIFTPKRDNNTNNALYPQRLGMYLARQIVNAHGGQLRVNNGRGHGLIIKLLLPLAGDEDTYLPLLDGYDPPPVAPTTTDADDNIDYKPPTRGLSMTVIESESRFTQKLYPEIEFKGHEIIPETTLDDALFNLKMIAIDMLVLEIDRPNSGLLGQVQRVRAQSDVPMVIVSLPEFEKECVAALQSGADDYFLVPINEEKLLAQLYAISNRRQVASRTAEPIRVGALEIDFSRRKVHLDSKLIDLTAKEYDLLRVLAMNRGHVMTHKQLLNKVWGPEHEDETQYLWVNISRLRRKLEPTKDSPRYIQNEPRVGYVFVTDVG